MTGKNIRLIIACHKACEVPEGDLYLPVHVGAAGKESIGFARDDTGENISEKNPVYCELTGLYWAWKNLDADYLGLVHYRRYFAEQRASLRHRNKSLADVLTRETAEQLLDRYRVLVPKKRRYYIESVYTHYAHTFEGAQLEAARKILAGQYPEYLPDFDRLMKGTSAYIFNMFLMDRQLTDVYCTWLFDILERVEQIYSVEGMTDFEKRYAGRISERLFNVWLQHQVRTGKLRKESIHEIPYLYLGTVDWRRKITSFLKAKFFHKKYDKSF